MKKNRKIYWGIKMKLHYYGDSDAGYYYAVCDSRETATKLIVRFENDCMQLTWGIRDYDFTVIRKAQNPECSIFTAEEADWPSDDLVQCINCNAWTEISYSKYDNMKWYPLFY